MNFSHIENSKPLQRMLAYLRQKGTAGATTLELVAECQIMNPATMASHLRFNGFQIDCSYERTSESGARIYKYRLIEKGAETWDSPPQST